MRQIVQLKRGFNELLSKIKNLDCTQVKIVFMWFRHGMWQERTQFIVFCAFLSPTGTADWCRLVGELMRWCWESSASTWTRYPRSDVIHTLRGPMSRLCWYSHWIAKKLTTYSKCSMVKLFRWSGGSPVDCVGVSFSLIYLLIYTNPKCLHNLLLLLILW